MEDIHISSILCFKKIKSEAYVLGFCLFCLVLFLKSRNCWGSAALKFYWKAWWDPILWILVNSAFSPYKGKQNQQFYPSVDHDLFNFFLFNKED